jgi:Spy/CpxP family protein refolding chaperone
MRGTAFHRLTAGVLLLAFAGPAGAQSSFKWWQAEQFRKDLSLTTDQAARIDAIFQTTFPQLKQGKEELDRQEAQLSRLIESNADEPQVARQIDRVESTRAGLNRMRALMLFHMRQVLTPEQNAKFKALHDKFIQEHRRTGEHHETSPKQ